MTLYGSRKTAGVAIEMALTGSREQEKEYKQRFAKEGFRTAAVDYGGDFISSVNKIIERAVVASKREGVIKEQHADEGAGLAYRWLWVSVTIFARTIFMWPTWRKLKPGPRARKRMCWFWKLRDYVTAVRRQYMTACLFASSTIWLVSILPGKWGRC